MTHNSKHIPDKFILQWHITDRCNLSCKHCYQENTCPDLPLDTLLSFAAQFEALIRKWRKNNTRLPFHINITGGEPFIRNDFSQILDYLETSKTINSFAILSNGTMIPDSFFQNKYQKLKFIQISIDGSENTHNNIRGDHSFTRAVDGIKKINQNNIPSMISFTATKNNIADFKHVVKLARKLKVNKIWTDRLIPAGNGKSMDVLSTQQTKAYIKNINIQRLISKFIPFNKTDVAANRALQFLYSKTQPYSCSAGDSLMTLMPDGTIFPCRRLPIDSGNLLHSNIETIYHESTILNDIRNPNTLDPNCLKCIYHQHCKSGLKCLSYALTNNYHSKDPGCWL